MNSSNIRRNLLEVSGVVSVRIEGSEESPVFRVKLARRIGEEDRVVDFARDRFNLELVDSFENEERQLILRFS